MCVSAESSVSSLIVALKCFRIHDILLLQMFKLSNHFNPLGSWPFYSMSTLLDTAVCKNQYICVRMTSLKKNPTRLQYTGLTEKISCEAENQGNKDRFLCCCVNFSFC